MSVCETGIKYLPKKHPHENANVLMLAWHDMACTLTNIKGACFSHHSSMALQSAQLGVSVTGALSLMPVAGQEVLPPSSQCWMQARS